MSDLAWILAMALTAAGVAWLWIRGTERAEGRDERTQRAEAERLRRELDRLEER